MTNFPPGKWTSLLIGDQWPDDTDLAAIMGAQRNRGNTEAAFLRLAEALRNAQTGPLTDQHGRTVDDLSAVFHRGEQHAQVVANRNGTKQKSYVAAYNSALNLQHDLTALAEEGNKEIQEIETSSEPEANKISRITDTIQRFRTLANLVSAKYSTNVLEAIQSILDADGAGQSARQFTSEQGLEPAEMFRQSTDSDSLRDHISGMLGKPGAAAGIAARPSLPGSGSKLSPPTVDGLAESPGSGLGARRNSSPPDCHPVAQPANRSNPGSGMGIPANYHPPAPTPLGPARSVGTAISPEPMRPAQAPTSASHSGPSALPQTPTPSISSPRASASAPWAPSPELPTITPTELAQSFNKGMESGAPFSAAAHAAPPLPITSTEPQISHAAQTLPSPAPTPQGHVPVVDSPQPVHHVTAAETPPPTPIVAAAQPISPPVTPQAVGPLPTYGSDLRPPVATTITPTQPQSTPLPPSATPSSAPVTPSSGHSAANQPALVRQTASSAPPPPPPTQGTQAVAATATGAAIGTASADATARKRLQRLVNTVARQQPRLAWAAGDRADNTTLLVTDLASGWIPPGIDLPSAVTLLPPARRRGNVEVLLGDVTVTASYTPTHHLADDGEQTPTSPRPRSVPDVSDLGWELSQATQWRDGLPRLAHTLAKAASAGTGVLDSEIDLLHEHLAETSKRVLDNYPDHIDTHDVGNWQLLAALDALVVGDKAAANYHLAWFLAAKAG